MMRRNQRNGYVSERTDRCKSNLFNSGGKDRPVT
jgi:hypothetical protein